ncbi:MAG: leucine-rich repeat protein [Clostridium sp.]|nr:leucine-rich repeat protein [Clostridium sp.]
MLRKRRRYQSFLLVGVLIIGLFTGINGKVQTVYAAGGTAAEVVALAASQVGYHEKASNYNLDNFTANSGSANYNKYARDVGVTNGQAWCATFIWWCMKNAGVSYANYPSRTTVTRDWFVQRGQYHARGSYVPRPGDYVVFGNVSHCGIVESVSGYSISVIEGNSGDQVKRNYYNCMTSTYVTGFGTIQYNGSSSALASTGTDTTNPGSPYPVPSGNLKNGSRGDLVKWVQKFLNDVRGAGLAVDGIYGSGTTNAVKTFQQQNGLTADGIVGSQTTAKMLSLWRSKAAQAAIKPLDLGNEFCAVIYRSDIWKPIKNTGSNIVLWDEETTADYYWLFKKQNDGSYVIWSLYDGTVIDADHGYAVNGTNVMPFAANGGNNQKWYICASGNSYKLVPQYAGNLAMDVTGAGTADNTNIELYEANESVAQRFSIYKVSHSNLSGIAFSSGYQTNMDLGAKQTLKCSFSPSNTKSNMVIWESSNTSVAAVDRNGMVTAKATGKATIKCTSTYNKNISASVQITVKEKEQPTTEAETKRPETPATEAATEQPEAPTTEVEIKQPETTTTEAETKRPETSATEAETKQPETPATEAAAEQPETPTTEVETKWPETPTTKQPETPTTETAAEQPEIPATETEMQTETDMNTATGTTTEVPPEQADTDEEPEGGNDKSADNDSKGWSDKNADNDWKEEDLPLPKKKGTILTDTANKCEVEVTSDSTKNPTVRYLEPSNEKEKKVTIPSVVRVDGITYKVTSISEYAFYNNPKLTSVTIGKNISEIGDSAFENCKKLKSVTIPKSVKSIGKNAFRNCKALKKITIKSTVLKKIGKNAFRNIHKKASIRVPKGRAKTYTKMLKRAGCK